MATKGNNFQYKVVPGCALKAQSVTTTTVDGIDIVEPWAIGRQITFILVGGAIAATVTGITAKLFGKKRADGLYSALKASDGTTDLAFTASLLADAGQLETAGFVMGTLPFDKVSGLEDEYSAIRLSYTAGGTGAALVGCVYVINDLLSFNDNAVDDLWAKVA